MTASRAERAARCAAVWLCASLLGGCALWRHDDAGKPAAPALPPSVQLEVQAPSEVRELLQDQLDLARLPRLAAGQEVSENELQRLIEVAPEQARSLVETQGYFNAEITVERLPDTTPPRVRVTVQPGPRTQVSSVDVQIRGPLAESAAAGDDMAVARERRVRDGWALQPGAVFTAAGWSGAKASALAVLRAEAYLSADWARTQATVDAQAHQARLTLEAESGPQFRTGDLRIQGLQHQDEAVVRNLADFPPGTPATEQVLLDFQERLQKSGLFEGATVLVDPATSPDPAAAPVTVQLTEQRLQQATVGVGINANTGPRVTLDHEHRRVFGQALTARNRFEFGAVRRGWDGELSTQTLPGLYRNFVGGTLERLISDADEVNSVRLRIGRAQDKKRLTRTLFAEMERSTTRTTAEPITRSQTNALSLQFQSTWREVDDVLLPTRGRVLTAQLGAGQASSNPGETGPFGRLYGRVNQYWALPHSWYAQGRLELGQVFVRDTVAAPESLRFRAGGEESVRGYSYRSLAPTVNGVVSSGNVLFTTSAEIAHPLTARFPALWGAAFIDAGRSAQHWNDLKAAVGVGVGLRYRSPVGPLSLDLAYGEELRQFRVHLTAGVAF